MRDPTVLYVTIAQVSATLVAILGGFLLTYGYAYRARHRRVTHQLAVLGH